MAYNEAVERYEPLTPDPHTMSTAGQVEPLIAQVAGDLAQQPGPFMALLQADEPLSPIPNEQPTATALPRVAPPDWSKSSFKELPNLVDHIMAQAFEKECPMPRETVEAMVQLCRALREILVRNYKPGGKMAELDIVDLIPDPLNIKPSLLEKKKRYTLTQRAFLIVTTFYTHSFTGGSTFVEYFVKRDKENARTIAHRLVPNIAEICEELL